MDGEPVTWYQNDKLFIFNLTYAYELQLNMYIYVNEYLTDMQTP